MSIDLWNGDGTYASGRRVSTYEAICDRYQAEADEWTASPLYQEAILGVLPAAEIARVERAIEEWVCARADQAHDELRAGEED